MNEWAWPFSNKTLFTKAGGRSDLSYGLKFADPSTRMLKASPRPELKKY